MSDLRPILTSRQQRVVRQQRIKQLIPWFVVFALGGLVGYVIAPDPHVIDANSGCTYSNVIPAKVLPKPTDVKVNVYNATKRVGLASITSVDLHLRGFKQGVVDSSSEDVAGIAIIRYAPGARPAADRLAAYVPGALMKLDRSKPNADKAVDLILGDAFGQLAPDEQVSAILAVPSASASGKGCPTF